MNKLLQKKLTLTKIPNLDLIVVRQGAGTRFFVSAPDSFIIDKYGMKELIKGMISVGFITEVDFHNIIKESVNEN